MLKLSSRRLAVAFALACAFVPSAAWSDPPRVVFWGDPNLEHFEIRDLQPWLPAVVANRFPEDSLVIVSHGNYRGMVQVPDRGRFEAVFPDSPQLFIDSLRNDFGNRRLGSNTWFAWCHSGARCSTTWGDLAASQFPGHNFYTFEEPIKFLPKYLSGPGPINPVTFDPVDANSTALLWMKKPKILRHATDAQGAPLAFVPLEGPRGQRIVGTGAAHIGMRGTTRDVQTSIEIPRGFVVRLASGSEEFHYQTIDTGHLGLPNMPRGRAVLLVPGGATPRQTMPTSRAQMMARPSVLGIASNPGVQMMGGDIGNVITMVILEARHEGVGPIEAAQNVWNRPAGPSLHKEFRGGWKRDPWYKRAFTFIGLALGGRADLFCAYTND